MNRRSQDPILFTTMALSVIFGKIMSVALLTPPAPGASETNRDRVTASHAETNWTRGSGKSIEAASNDNTADGLSPSGAHSWLPVQSVAPSSPCDEHAEKPDPAAPAARESSVD